MYIFSEQLRILYERERRRVALTVAARQKAVRMRNAFDHRILRSPTANRDYFIRMYGAAQANGHILVQ